VKQDSAASQGMENGLQLGSLPMALPIGRPGTVSPTASSGVFGLLGQQPLPASSGVFDSDTDKDLEGLQRWSMAI